MEQVQGHEQADSSVPPPPPSNITTSTTSILEASWSPRPDLTPQEEVTSDISSSSLVDSTLHSHVTAQVQPTSKRDVDSHVHPLQVEPSVQDDNTSELNSNTGDDRTVFFNDQINGTSQVNDTSQVNGTLEVNGTLQDNNSSPVNITNGTTMLPSQPLPQQQPKTLAPPAPVRSLQPISPRVVIFPWSDVMKNFESQHNSFCERDNEESIVFDYVGVNEEATPVDTDLRRCWARLLIVDAILAYSEHDNKAMELTQSRSFQYHKVLRQCIQACKRELKLTRDSEETKHLSVALSPFWSSMEILQQQIETVEDNTVNDILECYLSCPLLESGNGLGPLINKMVREIPPIDPPFDPMLSIDHVPDLDHSTVSPDDEEKFAFDESRTPQGDEQSSCVTTQVINEHSSGQSQSGKVKVIISWAKIAEEFKSKFMNFLALGYTKLVSDICDLSTHYAPSQMNGNEWAELLLLDALLCALLCAVTKKRTALCFHQHRALRQSIQSVIRGQLSADGSNIKGVSDSHDHQGLVDISESEIIVESPWDNIISLIEQYCDILGVSEPVGGHKTHKRVMGRQARDKVAKGLLDCHVFQHMSLGTTVKKVTRHLYWGEEIPSIPSQHDSKVSSNLMLFCRTILAASSQNDSNEEISNFSMSTFCSNILELDKGHRNNIEPILKKQRT